MRRTNIAKNKALCIGTLNRAKFDDIKIFFSDLEQKGLNLVLLNKASIKDRAPETGSSFRDIALEKAKFYADKTGLPTLSDDGGLCIDALNGAPGISSHRWIGYEADDEELIAYTLKKMENIPLHKRTAYLSMCLCFYDPLTNSAYFFQEQIKGIIAKKPNSKRTKGYPYRALFIISKFGKYYDNLDPSEHKQVNHRFRALSKLKPIIKKHFNLQ